MRVVCSWHEGGMMRGGGAIAGGAAPRHPDSRRTNPMPNPGPTHVSSIRAERGPAFVRGASGAAERAAVRLRAVLPRAVLLVLRAVLPPLRAVPRALCGRSLAVLGSAAAWHCSFVHPQIVHPPP